MLKLEEPFPGTPFFEQLSNFDFYADEPVIVKEARIEAEQLPKELIFIPGFLLLGLIYLLQRSRAGREPREEGVPA